MNMRQFAFAFLTVALALCVTTPATAAADAPRPNIVFILADDLGYGDLGCYGSTKIHTPNIDRLSAQGTRLTAHYSGNTVCATSRCTLMTGLHPGHAYIRDNRPAKGYPDGQEPVPANYLTLPLTMKKLGYSTGAFGKWGLGPMGSSGDPLKQGIDRFYGFNCQGVAHNYYPTHLWDNENHIALNNPPMNVEGQKLAPGDDVNSPASYAKWEGKEYAPDLIGAQALKFLRDNKDRPFFLYYPTTVPHLALQVPDDSLKEYEGKFPDEPYVGGKGYTPNRTPHAAYAAMITRMDREVGRVMDLLKEFGLEDNTIVIFTSDNGPLWDRFGGTDTAFFKSSGIFRGFKQDLYEGGLRMPCIVRWKTHIAPGAQSDRVTGFEDWLPTLLDLIGASSNTPKHIDGISFAPTLLGQSQPPRPFLYREFPASGGSQFIRVGDWKAIHLNLNPSPKKPLPPARIELYDLAKDPAETTDVAAEHPDIVEKLGAMMKREHVKSEIFPMRELDGK
ncbi:MAG TPA: arylsulfatase [Humisphaera sp.]|nr:arylsulfatase [Humisphaera sp.]